MRTATKVLTAGNRKPFTDLWSHNLTKYLPVISKMDNRDIHTDEKEYPPERINDFYLAFGTNSFSLQDYVGKMFLDV